MNDLLLERYQTYLVELDKAARKDLQKFEGQRLNLQRFQQEYVAQELTGLSDEARRRLQAEIVGNGPLETLLQDEDVTEILVTEHNNVWLERRGKLQKWVDQFCSTESYLAFLERLCSQAKIIYDLKTPMANGVWNGFRVHIIAPPLSPALPQLTLRRQSIIPWTFRSLQTRGWAENEAVEVLESWVQQGKNFLIVGSTGTGKTSVLNACLQKLPSHERVICIEDTSEIQLPNSISTKLLTRTTSEKLLPDFHQQELIKEALRMRPDRIVVGEVRGAEAKDLLMALATGHKGGLGTMHADGPRQALIRLEMLIQLGAPQWSVSAIRHLIRLSLDGVVVLKRQEDRRYLGGIYKITSLEPSGFCLETLFEAKS